MHDILGRQTRGFSQGERMKVACPSHHSQPPYLILDEPTNGLDVLTTRAVRQLIKHLKAQGTGIIFSSHLMHEVQHLCDSLSIICAGKVAASGMPAAIIKSTGCADLESAFAHFCQQSNGSDTGAAPGA